MRGKLKGVNEAQEPSLIEPDAPRTAAQPVEANAPVRGVRRARVWRWTRHVLILAVAILAAAIFTLFTVDIGHISIGGRSLQSIAATRASRYLEREMTIGRVSAFVTPGKFAFDDVVIQGPRPGDRPFLTAKRITVHVPWWTLFRKELFIEIRMTGWRMVIERGPDGTKLPRFKPRNPSGRPFAYKIRELAVHATGGEFSYEDHLAPWSVIGRDLDVSVVRAGNLNTYVGLARFSDGTVRIQQFEPMKADFNSRFQIKGGILDLKHIDLVTDGAESHVAGFVNFASWPQQEYNIQSTVDFNRMRELFFAKADWRLSGEGQFRGIFKFFKSGADKTGFDLSGRFTSDEAGLGIDNSEWRFPQLDGALQWTPDRFVVTRADTKFLDGRMRLDYGLYRQGPGRPAVATLNADYTDVDLYRFTRQFGWTALEPQGRMHGHVTMGWPNGEFGAAMEGKGTTVIRPPDGRTVAAPTLPSSSEPIPAEEPFQKYRPFGQFGVGADLTYRFGASWLEFGPSWAATPSTFVSFQGRARGGPANLPFHVTSHDWQNSDRLFAAIMSNFNRPMGAVQVGGRGTFDGVLTKSFNAPRIEGRFAGDAMRAFGVVWGRANGNVAVENSYLDLTDAVIEHSGGGRILTSGRYSLGYPRADAGPEIDAKVRAERMPLAPLLKAFELDDWPVDGVLALADLTLRGGYEKPAGGGSMRIENGTAWREPFEAATADLAFEGDGSIRLGRIELTKGPGKVTGHAWLSWADDSFSVVAHSLGIPIDQLSAFKFERAPLSGLLSFDATGSGSFDLPNWEVQARVPDLYAADEGVGAVRTRLTLANNILTIAELIAEHDRLHVDCQGNVAMNPESDATLRCGFTQTSLDPYLKFVAQELPFTRAIASGSVSLTGPLADTSQLSADMRVTDASLTLFDYELKNDGPLRMTFRENVFRLGTCGPRESPPACEPIRFKGVDTSLEIGGAADVTSRVMNLHASGQASLAVLQAFYPSLSASGGAELGATLTGSFDKPVLAGRAVITDGALRHFDWPHGLRQIKGPIAMEAGRISVDGLTGVMGDGLVTFSGGIELDGYRPVEFDLHASGQSMHLRFPEGLNSTVIADLDLHGPIKAPVLSGNVFVQKATYSLRFKPERGYLNVLSGVMGGEEPSTAEAAPSAFPLALAIKVRAPLMPFVENKSASALISGRAEIDISGTMSRPIVTGRVDVDRGEWLFSGNRYRMLSGSIDFTNPFRFDPIFEMTAETRIRTPGQIYLVTLRFTGTLDKLTPQISSDPWLPEFQIVSLLLGETPDVGAAELRARSSPQELQAQALRAAGFAIITSPITATVGSAVQRVTRIDSFQIVPVLGNEANLQALNSTRIVLGQRISNRIYLTYSRTLNSAQNEIILIEFDQNDQVSWVLSRNEDRSFALDFRLRYVFR